MDPLIVGLIVAAACLFLYPARTTSGHRHSLREDMQGLSPEEQHEEVFAAALNRVQAVLKTDAVRRISNEDERVAAIARAIPRAIDETTDELGIPITVAQRKQLHQRIAAKVTQAAS